jgi:hypothetical protein
MTDKWNFEGDYFTACNCDWGCPCNFNASPKDGHCVGFGAWSITAGRFDATDLAGARFALYYAFPGPIEQGKGVACAYVDSRANSAQREALELIGTGKAGGGIFGLFANDLVARWLPTKFGPIDFEFKDGKGRVRIASFGEAESELLSYPDGSVIRPGLDLPHGIEFKHGLMTNARRWRWQDAELSGSYADRYGAVAKVKFTEEGCVA